MMNNPPNDSAICRFIFVMLGVLSIVVPFTACVVGVAGSGKTITTANVIEKVQKP